MTSKTTKQPTIKLTITPGPVMPASRVQWRKWWAARIAEAKQSEAVK